MRSNIRARLLTLNAAKSNLIPRPPPLLLSLAVLGGGGGGGGGGWEQG